MDFAALVHALDWPLDQTSLATFPQLNPTLNKAAAIETAAAGELSFISSAKRAEAIAQTQASAVILPPLAELQNQASDRGIAWIVTDDPRLLFAKALAVFYAPWQLTVGQHSTAVVHDSVQIGEGTAIAAQATVHQNVVLGNDVQIHANVVIYPGAKIGDRTVIHSGAIIHERSVIGADCVIHSGAVIGSEGFGFVPTAAGWHKMPQSGRTVLGNQVEVGCNTTIDRPAVGETRIGTGTKIDNLVQIGHGCKIGNHCVLVSQVGLAGEVTLGDRVVLAGQVGVAEKLTIGSGTVVTAKSGVVQDVPANALVSGFPTMPNKQWLRMSLLLRRLPELLRTR